MKKSYAIAKIRKHHGLKGALKTEFLYSNSLELFKSRELFLDLEGGLKKIDVEKTFGHVKNLFNLTLKDHSFEDIKDIRNIEIVVFSKEDEFCVQDLLNMYVEQDGDFFQIDEIHDFGAGIVLDVEGIMVSIDEIDLDSMHDDVVQAKVRI